MTGRASTSRVYALFNTAEQYTWVFYGVFATREAAEDERDRLLADELSHLDRESFEITEEEIRGRDA